MVNEELLIDCTPQETRVAVMVDGVLEDLHIERRSQRGIVCNVYKGKVTRVLPGMQSAFVDIGLERTAFLHVNDIHFARREDGSYKPIEYAVHAGDSILVQVTKEPIGTKGARLTTTISLAGNKLVYMPKEKHIGVSQRIEGNKERERLKSIITALVPEDEKGGYIVRTCAEGSSGEQFEQDMIYLKRLWKQIQDKAGVSAAPCLLYQDLYLEERALRDLMSDRTKRILVDTQSNYDKLRDFAKVFVPNATALLERYVGEEPLFEHFSIDKEISNALTRRVDLKSGGYLIFDQTEAMTTIDVNTGGYVGKRDFSDTVFKTNLEAARTIARQLRLRNLGGIIIVDFIDMDRDSHREAVLAELEKATQSDRVHTTVSRFTELGLVEMTRKRMRESLAHVLCEPCPVCGGRGEIRTALTVCYEIMREIMREWRHYREAKEFTIVASQTVIDMFLEDESQSLENLQAVIDCEISLHVETSYSQEQYDITFS